MSPSCDSAACQSNSVPADCGCRTVERGLAPPVRATVGDAGLDRRRGGQRRQHQLPAHRDDLVRKRAESRVRPQPPSSPGRDQQLGQVQPKRPVPRYRSQGPPDRLYRRIACHVGLPNCRRRCCARPFDRTNLGCGRPPDRMRNQRPFAEKCWKSWGDDQSPPQRQPIEANALTTTSPSWITPGSSGRSTKADPAGGSTSPPPDIGILQRIDDRRLAVRMLREAAAAGARSAIEAGRVVGGHRSIVVATVVVDQRHPANWIRCRQTALEYRNDLRCNGCGHHHLAEMGLVVETDEGQCAGRTEPSAEPGNPDARSTPCGGPVRRRSRRSSCGTWQWRVCGLPVSGWRVSKWGLLGAACRWGERCSAAGRTGSWC